MSITKESELIGMKKISEVVGTTLKLMREYAKVGMTTIELDLYGGEILKSYGAKSAPFETYGFPGFTCISVNKEAAHGIPSDKKILKEVVEDFIGLVEMEDYEEFENINKLKKEITEHFDKFFKDPEFDRLMSKAAD